MAEQIAAVLAGIVQGYEFEVMPADRGIQISRIIETRSAFG